MVLLLDASGSDDNIIKDNVATVAVTLTEVAGARVGVVVFNDSATVDVPLQYWDDTDQLRENIEGLRYTGNGTNTHIGINTAASILGNEGTRVILLLANGASNDREEAVEAAEAAKRARITIYAAAIGDDITEEELDMLVSYPPEEYRVSIAGFEARHSFITSACLSKHTTLTVYLSQDMGLPYCTYYMHFTIKW